jgi:protein involved in polysaccharide export with SLBB domain
MMTKTRSLLKLAFIFFFLVASTFVHGQGTNLSSTDLSTLKVDQLSDDQIRAFISRAEQSGMSEDQLEQAALARGMQPSEIEKLRTRIQKIQSEKDSGNDSENFRDGTKNYNQPDENSVTKRGQISGQKTQQDINEETRLKKEGDEEDLFENLNGKRVKKVKPEEKIFGYKLFNNKKISFEPSLNMPTPSNYQLGPGDELVIDIWGASQQTYKQKISSEGSISISNLGLVFLSGMTVEEATGVLKKNLSKIYAGLRGSSPNTFLKVSLGSVRSIKVNIVGDITVPGSYTLPALATVFNALYAAGGPALNGSLRNVKLVREGKTIAEIDFYEFLLKGEQKDNVRLQDQDVIFVNPYNNRVEVKGEVKRPGLYDMKDNESLKDLIYFTGGYTDKAYWQRLVIVRKTGKERKVFDVDTQKADSFKMANGDQLVVDSILNRFENRVEIKGAVYRPGIFAGTDSMTLKCLIEKADGLRGDAFKNRATIFRTKDDLTMEVIPIDLNAFMADSTDDIALEREDLVVIPSIFDIKEEYFLKIDGEVGKPGLYPYVATSTVEDLILRSGGLLESASFARLEIARRIKNNMAENASNQIAEIFQFKISQDLKLSAEASKFMLQPFDQVFIRRAPGYETQAVIKVTGEVTFPGNYVLSKKNEKISDFIKRAGGLTPNAYIKGARLVRKLPVNREQRMEALYTLMKHSKAPNDSQDSRNAQGIKDFKDLKEFNDYKDSIKIFLLTENEAVIGIDLNKVLSNPGSKYDINLQKGDSIIVPKELQTVRLNGGVLLPSTVRYDGSYSFRSYIARAGGFAPTAIKSKSYVINANGMVNRTHRIFLFKHFPRIDPGAEIYVPVRPERRGMSAGEAVSLVSTLGLIIVTIINTVKW